MAASELAQQFTKIEYLMTSALFGVGLEEIKQKVENYLSLIIERCPKVKKLTAQSHYSMLTQTENKLDMLRLGSLRSKASLDEGSTKALRKFGWEENNGTPKLQRQSAPGLVKYRLEGTQKRSLIQIKPPKFQWRRFSCEEGRLGIPMHYTASLSS